MVRGVIDRRLDGRDFLAGEYSIADMATYPWAKLASLFGQDMKDFPRMQAWLDRIAARPAVERGMAAGKELRKPPPAPGSSELKEAAKALFGQTAASTVARDG